MATEENILKKTLERLEGVLAIKFYPIKSSNILLHGYNSEARILYLVFKNKYGKEPDWVYQYRVNQMVYNNFLKAESAGTFFSEVIKPYAICKSPIWPK